MIVVVVNAFPKLSETFVRSELEGLAARGHRLIIASRAAPPDTKRHAGALVPGVEVVYLDAIRPGPALARLCRDRGARLLFAHFATGAGALAGSVAGELGLPYAVSLHAKDIYTSGTIALASLLARSAFATTCTAHGREFLAGLCPKASIHHLPHRVDAAFFASARAPSRPSPHRVLTVARFRPKKGVDTLIEACGLLGAQRFPVALDIVGYGPEEVGLRRAAAKLGLSARFYGPLTHEELQPVYASADVFVLPCRIAADGDRDGLPNVLIEAMAMRLPVITTPVSGIPEVVRHGETGFLVPPDRPDLLADQIRGVLTMDEDRRAAVEEAGFARIQARHALGEASTTRLGELLMAAG